MTDPKPIPRVTPDAASEALESLGRGTAPTQAKVEAYNALLDFLEQQRALSATRQADVETVRRILTSGMPHGSKCDFPHGLGECSCAPFNDATEALDRLAKE
jgi:hypothetical protein